MNPPNKTPPDKTPEMSFARFRHLADACGADLTLWPAGERAAAAALLAESEEAQRVLAQARVLDAWIALGAPKVDDAQVERVFAAIGDRVDREEGSLPSWFPPPRAFAPGAGRPRPFWPAAAFLAGMAVMGVLAGTENLSQPTSASTTGIASLVAPEPYLLAWNP